MPSNAPIPNLCISDKREGKLPVYIDVLRVPKSECPELPFPLSDKYIAYFYSLERACIHLFLLSFDTIRSNRAWYCGTLFSYEGVWEPLTRQHPQTVATICLFRFPSVIFVFLLNFLLLFKKGPKTDI